MSGTAILEEIVDHVVRQHCQKITSLENMEMNNNSIVEEKSEVKPERSRDPWKIREKLKSMPTLKKDLQERKSRGPMVAKPCILPVSNTTIQSNAFPSATPSSSSSSARSGSPAGGSRGARTPSPTNSAFQRHVVSRPRSPSFRYRHSSSQSSSGRRTPSPGAQSEPALSEDEALKRVERALRARLYLLQQPGPNSFLIGGDSPSHKFRVIIGPQTCSCARDSHCIHILFIMLRVLQVPRSDPSLWAKTLKNYEVETLLQSFHKRRCKKRIAPDDSGAGRRPGPGSRTSSTESLDSQHSKEEDVCPICLLEMIDGESLVQCEGCRNKLHHHCISVWFEECRSQRERLNCPLCRGEWTIQQVEESHSEPDEEGLSREEAESPDPPNHELPYCDVIPAEVLDKVQPWIEVFGEDLVACIYSRDWSTREKSMAHFRKRCVKYLATERAQNGQNYPMLEQTYWPMIDVACDLLNHVCSDPVYKVFVAALKGLRSLIAHITCVNEDDAKKLQRSLEPVVDNLLLKCAESNRQTSQLALSTLEELCKCQSGELAVGKRVSGLESRGLESLTLIVTRVLQYYPAHSVHWQWLLGRLVAVDRMLDLHGNKLLGQGHLMALVELAVREANNAHINIGRQARHVFISCARLSAHKTDVFQRLEDVLETADKNVQGRMRRRLSKVSSEFSVAQRAASLVRPEPAYDAGTVGRQTSAPPFPTPENSPRTPERFDYEEAEREAGVRPACQRLGSDESDCATSPLSPGAYGRDVSFRSEVTSPKRQPRLNNVDVAELCCHCEDKLDMHPSSSLLQRLAGQLLQCDDKCGEEYVEGRDWVKGPVLGTGAFSTCYQVCDKKTGKLMALKQITYCPDSDSDQEKAVNAIRSELSLTLRLRHRNVVQILGATQEENRFNLFVEWMPGGSVSSLLDKYGSFSEAVTRSYVRQILYGLAYLHENKIVHRDLKGANLLVDNTGHRIRIADFGASARLASKSTGAGEFKGQLLGTVAFMAPEVLRGENYGRSCDIWSVGCVVIEMVTCKPPWNANDLSNHLALIYKIASAPGPPSIPENVSSALSDLMHQCFRRDSAERPTANALLSHHALTAD